MHEQKEIWKDIEGYEGHYQASNKGHIRSLKHRYRKRYEPKTLKRMLNSNGYFYVALCLNNKVKRHKVSRLVADTFVTNIKGKSYVNHKDGNKQNDHALNLEWCTMAENQKHAVENDLCPKGENHGMSKLTRTDVLDIRNTYQLGCFSQTEIAKAYGVSQSSITSILNHKTWVHV